MQQYLCTSAFPDPELMIRTSGEYRISNFLLYQLAYAELYFTNVRWPDFRKKTFLRRFLTTRDGKGGLVKQVSRWKKK
ncbi:MAG: undecaprenyl diphosphate synthase family protein [Bacteroidota bacterium]